MNKLEVLLGVNIDHVATLRQARKTTYPNVLDAALLAEQAGADGITAHLREDRRHIQDHDILVLKERIATRLNLEMAVTDSMLAFADKVRPHACCLVPEKREELTTEGGLDVIYGGSRLHSACDFLADIGIHVSLFIDPDLAQIDAAIKARVPVIELHTGCYAEALTPQQRALELARLQTAARYAHAAGLQVNAGHGLTMLNVQAICAIPEIVELNIGHSIIAQALFLGMFNAVKELKELILKAR